MELSDIQVAFQYGIGDDALEREIIRNVQTILTTPLGTCPLYREFGLDISALDNPLDVAQNLYAVEVMETVESWEPRVKVQEVKFTPDVSGRLTAKVVISYDQ
jgi:hypothetical protein